MYAFDGHSEIESIGWYMIWKHVEYIRYKTLQLPAKYIFVEQQKNATNSYACGKYNQFVCKQEYKTNLCASKKYKRICVQAKDTTEPVYKQQIQTNMCAQKNTKLTCVQADGQSQLRDESSYSW